MLYQMLIFTEWQLLLQQVIVRELFQEEVKEKLEYFKLENKHRLCWEVWKNIEEEYGVYKSGKIMNKQLVQVLMVHVLFGI